jgi:hypothetical protein
VKIRAFSLSHLLTFSHSYFLSSSPFRLPPSPFRLPHFRGALAGWTISGNWQIIRYFVLLRLLGLPGKLVKIIHLF